MITENLSTLKIHKLTQEQYDRELSNGNIDETALYLTPDEEIDLSGYVTVERLDQKANLEHYHDDRYYTEPEIDSKLATKSNTTHNHDSVYDTKGTAESKANAVQSNLDAVSDELTDHVDNTDIHFTAAERTKLSGIATGANKYTHPSSGVTAGTYKSITVNEQGHVTGGTNPTTLTGYGITDAESKGAANNALSSAKGYTDEKITEITEDITTVSDELSDHSGNADIHVTDVNKSNWNTAYSHSQANHAPVGAQANVIETVKVNGTSLTPSSKVVNITVPTKVSQLTNDSGYKTTDNNTTYTLTKDGSNIILTGSDGSTNTVSDSDTKVIVDSSLSSTSTNPVQNKVVNSALSGKVPTSRTVNGKALSANITLSASDVGADASGTAATKATEALNSAKTYTDTTVKGAIADLIGSADTTMDTLGEIQTAMQENESIVDALNDAIGTKANTSDLISHTGNKSNPHGVTKSQVGLANVPNVTTNNQTPTYNDATELVTLTSGETVATAFGKIKLAISNLISHIANKSNPHGVTKSQVGLSNVPNVATNDQTPTFTQASSRANLTSGEKISVSLGKIMKWFSDLKTVAFTGAYSDLSGKPTIPTKVSELTNDSGYKTTDNNTTYSLSKDGSTIVLTGSDGSTTSVADSKYTHPTTTGNKHIPAGGASGQVLKWSSDGTAVWGTDNNTTYGVATTSALGLVKSGTDITVDSSGNVSVNDDSHNHVISNVDGLQSALDGKSATGHTHNYAGSSSAGGAATSANKVNTSLTVKFNSGTTEGTNMFTFNGSAAKSVNITPSAIGAATSGHTHDDRYYTESEVDTKLSGKANNSHGNHVPATETANNAKFLRNDNTWQTVTPANIGALSTSGIAANASRLSNTSAIGSATNPVYFNANGVPVKTTYALGASVPSDAKFTDTVYTHPTSSGNKHIPSGGSSGQILRWSADGTAVWGNDNNTTYSAATQSTQGLMSAADKKKLDNLSTTTTVVKLVVWS